MTAWKGMTKVMTMRPSSKRAMMTGWPRTYRIPFMMLRAMDSRAPSGASRWRPATMGMSNMAIPMRAGTSSKAATKKVCAIPKNSMM